MPRLECELAFFDTNAFAKFVEVLYNKVEEEKLIESSQAVKHAYEQYQLMCKLAKGEEDGI